MVVTGRPKTMRVVDLGRGVLKWEKSMFGEGGCDGGEHEM